MSATHLLCGIVPAETLACTVRLIEATAKHMIPNDVPLAERDDMAVFLDLDLSILGATEAAFDRNEAGVRHEYRDIPDEAFREGRSRILETFLARAAVFLEVGMRPLRDACTREPSPLDYQAG